MSTVLVITKKVDPWEQVAFNQPRLRARAVSDSDNTRCTRCEDVWQVAQRDQAEWSWDTTTINEAVDNYSHLDVCDCAYAEDEDEDDDCVACQGTGSDLGHPCLNCAGTGVVEYEKEEA